MAFDKSCFLVIGAYGGIGSVVCKILKKSNANLLIAGRDSSRLEAFSNELSCSSFTLDASDFSQMDSLIELP